MSLVYRSVKPKEESGSVSGMATERLRAKKTLLAQMEEKDDSVTREVSLAPSDDSSASGSSTHSMKDLTSFIQFMMLREECEAKRRDEESAERLQLEKRKASEKKERLRCEVAESEEHERSEKQEREDAKLQKEER